MGTKIVAKVASTFQSTRQVVGIGNININGIPKTTVYDATAPKRPNAFFSKNHHLNNKSSSRQTVNNPKSRIKATIEDAKNYINEIKAKGVLSESQVTTDNRYIYYKFMKKCDHGEMKFKKNGYLSWDKLHNEWEYFTRPDRHEGAINVITGKLDVSRQDKARFLRVK